MVRRGQEGVRDVRRPPPRRPSRILVRGASLVPRANWSLPIRSGSSSRRTSVDAAGSASASTSVQSTGTRSASSSRTPTGRSPRSGWSPSSTAGRSTGDRRAGDVAVRLRHADAGPAALADPRSVRPGGTARPTSTAGSTTPATAGRSPCSATGGVVPGVLVELAARAGRRGVADSRRGRGHGDRHAAAHRGHDARRRAGVGVPLRPRRRTASCRIERWADQDER